MTIEGMALFTTFFIFPKFTEVTSNITSNPQNDDLNFENTLCFPGIDLRLAFGFNRLDLPDESGGNFWGRGGVSR